ncbi:MAG: nuclear transport factor 2 family protein [Myxococcales bacterium]|nr:nuclear transport factor 2 family protein [Myxococcales bacterium]
MLAVILALLPLLASQEVPLNAVNRVLDDFHDAAAKADGDRYFAHFAADAIFVGTDATEHWTLAEFRAYAAPHFAKGHGWTYVPFDRRVRFGTDGRTAWFVERLRNEKYGEMRGSGVLQIQRGIWVIEQYVLSFPIPNEKAAAVLDLLAGPPAKKPAAP